MVKTGLEIFFEKRINEFSKIKIGLVVNQSSINSKLIHSIKLFYNNKKLNLTTLFGPQHGIRGETQDNMIEWEGFRDPVTNLPVYSLYGKTRKPNKDMLENVDAIIFDIQDIGAKYYTFIYTMSYVMQSCAKYGKKFIVLDRPNPITGKILEGGKTYKNFTSFVGLYPIIIRHGMTIGELALLFNKEFNINCDLTIIKMERYERSMWYDETGLFWVMPSPNIPALTSAICYPGMCLFEGTNISEGRGTTKPFEFFGAPFIDPEKIYNKIKDEKLDGVAFRPVYFQPTFNKWFGKLCGGLQIYILDRNKYESITTAISLLKATYEMYPKQFKWKEPPYEYEYNKLPFDILIGNNYVRPMIEKGEKLTNIKSAWQNELLEFIKIREKYLLY